MIRNEKNINVNSTSVLLYSCKVRDPVKCIDYTGPNECIKFPDGSEEIRGPR